MKSKNEILLEGVKNKYPNVNVDKPIYDENYFDVISKNEKRICSYRNCGCLIPDDVRADSKYCNIKCRGNERTYVKRELRAIKKQKEEVVNNIINYEKNKDLLELYLKIYGK